MAHLKGHNSWFKVACYANERGLKAFVEIKLTDTFVNPIYHSRTIPTCYVSPEFDTFLYSARVTLNVPSTSSHFKPAAHMNDFPLGAGN